MSWCDRPVDRKRRGATNARRVACLEGSGFGVESLEPRTLLFAWSAQEVYLAELVNRARANPTAEAQRLGINLAAGLTGGELARLVPQEPLALNEALTRAARDHSLDMAVRNYFNHMSPSPDYTTPTSRVQAYGYPGTAGENIAAGYTTVDAVHRAWLESLGHRKNVLSLHASFDSDFHYDEIGVGLAFNAGGNYNHYFTQDFGYQGASPVRYILGVVFDDANSNGFYGIGEGAANVRIDVRSGGTIVGTYTTDAAGNYQIVVPAGSYTVRFTDLGTSRTFDRSVVVTDKNVKADAMMAEINPPPPPPDDHADAGQWGQATVVPIDPTSGNGTYAGRFETGDDTDLFRFTASVAGVYHVSVNAISANQHVMSLYSGAQQLIVTTPGGQLHASHNLTAAAGQTFYLLVSGNIVQLNGNYVVLIEGPGEGDPDPDPDPDPETDDGHLAEASLPLGAGMMMDGRYGVSYLSAELRPMFAMRNGDGSWTRIDLLSEAGGPGVQGKLVTWSDSRDGSTYVAARSDQGVIVYERRANGTWTVRNLTRQLNRPRIDGDLTLYIENNGRAHLAGMTANGKFIDYKMMGVRNAQGAWKWSFLNVSNTHLTFRGRTMPVMAGPLEGIVTPRGSWNVFGLDVQGNIQLFFKEKGLRWDVVNLSQFVGTPILTGKLTVYQGPERSIGVAGRAANGNVWITGFTEGSGWSASNASAGKVVQRKMRGGGLTTFVNANGIMHIVGLNAAGRVVMYKYNPNNGKWGASLPTNLVGGGGTLLSGDLTATLASNGVGVSIVGQTAEGRIIRYTWQPGQGWRNEDVSERLAA